MKRVIFATAALMVTAALGTGYAAPDEPKVEAPKAEAAKPEIRPAGSQGVSALKERGQQRSEVKARAAKERARQMENAGSNQGDSKP